MKLLIEGDWIVIASGISLRGIKKVLDGGFTLLTLSTSEPSY